MCLLWVGTLLLIRSEFCRSDPIGSDPSSDPIRSGPICLLPKANYRPFCDFSGLSYYNSWRLIFSQIFSLIGFLRSFEKARLHFQAFSWHEIKIAAENAVTYVKKVTYPLRFCNLNSPSMRISIHIDVYVPSEDDYGLFIVKLDDSL